MPYPQAYQQIVDNTNNKLSLSGGTMTGALKSVTPGAGANAKEVVNIEYFLANVNNTDDGTIPTLEQGNTHYTWTVDQVYSANTNVTLPEGISYPVGKGALRLALDGAVLSPGYSYNEVVTGGTTSSSVSFDFDLNTGDVLDIWVVKSVLVSETNNVVETYTVPSGGLTTNSILDIPNDKSYIVGRNQLVVSYNGVMLYNNVNYEEFGEDGDISTKVKFTMPFDEGDIIVYTILNRYMNIVDSNEVGCPIGTIIWSANNSVPAGFLLCDGAAVNRTVYRDLFDAIGTTYGTGDGSTTFNLPNLIGRFAEGSATAGTVKEAGLPNITGTLGWLSSTTDNNITGNYWTGSALRYASYSSTNGQRADVITSTAASYDVTFNASWHSSIYKDDCTTVQPPSVALLPCIKAFGAITNTGGIDFGNFYPVNKMGIVIDTGKKGTNDNSIRLKTHLDWNNYTDDTGKNDKSLSFWDSTKKVGEFTARMINASSESSCKRQAIMSCYNPWISKWSAIYVNCTPNKNEILADDGTYNNRPVMIDQEHSWGQKNFYIKYSNGLIFQCCQLVKTSYSIAAHTSAGEQVITLTKPVSTFLGGFASVGGNVNVLPGDLYYKTNSTVGVHIYNADTSANSSTLTISAYVWGIE